MRWVHRSSFQLRPIRGQQPGAVNLIPIPNSDNLFVDSGWYGTIVVETEGTNEALADLQDRCGLGAFPPRPQVHAKPTPAQIENRIVFRILRERRWELLLLFLFCAYCNLQSTWRDMD